MTVKPHPVAALLTDEMRARVRAATFEDVLGQIREVGHMYRCPLAVATGRPNSGVTGILRALGIDMSAVHADATRTVINFANMADFGRIRPDQVKALLGCEDDDDGR